MLCRRTDFTSESIIFDYGLPSKTHNKILTTVVFRNNHWYFRIWWWPDLFSSLCFFRCHQAVDRCFIPAISSVCLKIENLITFIRFRGADDLQQKVKMKIFSYCDSHSYYFQSIFCLEVSQLQKNTEEVSSVSSSRSMEDILEENAALKYQNKWLIDVITKNITELSSRIQKNTEEVSSVR